MSEKPGLLITGGSGYLGQRLVRCAQAHWDVTATYFSRRPLISDCRWTRLDVREAEQVVRLFEQVAPQVVIHTAALRGGEDLNRVNVDGTRHVVLAAARVGARMIHLSTDALFDGRQGNYVESDSPSAITPYGRSKAGAEALLAELMPQATVVRTSLIYGFDALDHQTRWMLETLRQGQLVRLFTDERRCPIWVETLAAALIELATQYHAGVLHVAGGQAPPEVGQAPPEVGQALDRYEFGTRLLCFHGADLSGVVPARASALGLVRPLDCTLDITRAKKLLKTPLLGVDETIARQRESWTRSQQSC
jgi:dTDP-4-dehydrorhamnose reductase